MVPSLWTWATIAIFAILVAIVNKKKSKKRNLPPSPRGLPIIGHLHLLGKNPHHDLHNLAKKHGPIMHLKLGFVDNIIVSTPSAAEEIYKTHDLVLAGRPTIEVLKYLNFGHKGLVFAQYGQYWRTMRKVCMKELLSNLKINSFKSMRREELGLLVESLKQAALDRDTVNLSAAVASLSADMSCLMVYGQKYTNRVLDLDEKGIKALTQESAILTGTFNLADFFPFLSRFDLQGLTKKSKAISKNFDDFFEKILLEHEETGKEMQKKTLTSALLDLMKSGETDFPIERSHVKAIMLDMLQASMDTSATVIDWTLSEILRHPEVMKKVQKELEEKIGMNRQVEESDLDKLKYLEMVVNEVFRLHPAVPLLLPHEALEDCTVDGFHIPKKSRITINVWAIGRNSNAWSDPDKFIPERFLGRNIDVRGKNFELIPFGSGRRGCPGMQMALVVVKLIVAQLLHCFHWELPGNLLPSEMDMTEDFGLVMYRAENLMAIPAYPLHIDYNSDSELSV